MNIPLKRYWDLLNKHLQTQKKQFALLARLLLSSIGLQVGTPHSWTRSGCSRSSEPGWHGRVRWSRRSC